MGAEPPSENKVLFLLGRPRSAWRWWDARWKDIWQVTDTTTTTCMLQKAKTASHVGPPQCQLRAPSMAATQPSFAIPSPGSACRHQAATCVHADRGWIDLFAHNASMGTLLVATPHQDFNLFAGWGSIPSNKLFVRASKQSLSTSRTTANIYTQCSMSTNV